jgi:hypothetical protein
VLRAPRRLRSLPDVIEAACVIGIAAVLSYSLLRWSPILKGELLSASPISYASAYLLTSRLLRRQGVGALRIFISLCSMVSGIWLYEVFYHYAYGGVSFDRLVEEASTVGALTPAVGGPFPLPYSVLMVLLVFVGYHYMRLTRWFFICLSISLLTFYLWVATGYPQFHHPEWWPSSTPLLAIIPAEREAIIAYGLLFNSLTKLPTVLIPSTLFLKGGEAR